MPVIELEEVQMDETTDESLEAVVAGGGFSQTGGITHGCCLI
jgi:hypothetical protein